MRPDRLPAVKKPHTLRAQQPFVGARAHNIDLLPHHVQLQGAEMLDRVDEKDNAGIATGSPEFVQAQAVTVNPVDRTDGKHPGSIIQAGQQLHFGAVCRPGVDAPNLHAPALQMQPGQGVAREILVQRYDVVARAPFETADQRIDAGRRVVQQ